MSRRLIVLPLAIVIAVFSPVRSFGQPPGVKRPNAKAKAPTPKTIKLGESVEGELTEEQINRNQEFPDGYISPFKVTLKAGQRLKVSASVVGETRRVGIFLFDPTNQRVGRADLNQKTSVLTSNGVTAKGTYTLVVLSDKIGPFTLIAIDPNAEAPGAANQADGIAFNEAFEGELSDADDARTNPGLGRLGGLGGFQTYSVALPVKLRARQALVISGSVTGTPRRIGLKLFDPAGAEIASQEMSDKTVTLKVKQVNASGLGKIVVESNKIGPFTLIIVDPEDTATEKPTAQLLKEKINKLKAELDATEAMLKTIESGSQEPQGVPAPQKLQKP